MAIKDTLGKMKTGLDHFLFRTVKSQDNPEPAAAYNQQEAYTPDPYTQQGPYVPQNQFIRQDDYTQQTQYQYAPQQQYTQQTTYTQQMQYAQQYTSPYTAAPSAVNPSMQMPGAAAAAEPAAEADPAAAVKAAQRADQEIDLMSVRSIQDCRNAISMLRAGAIVFLVMEGITDTNEMRRFVDTLSGACFSLNATISKVSHHGCYLLAPRQTAVMMDPVINQMNMSPKARMRQQQMQQAQAYAAGAQANPYQPQPSPYANNAYQPNAYAPQGAPMQQGAYDPQGMYAQQSYDPRMEARVQPQAQTTRMVERTGARPAAMPVFEQQMTNGYVPDTDA